VPRSERPNFESRDQPCSESRFYRSRPCASIIKSSISSRMPSSNLVERVGERGPRCGLT
jgi:hypothetical protein